MYKQLTYLPNDLEDLEKKIDGIQSSTDKVRKSLYVRHNELARMILEIKIEFDAWKTTFCKEKQ